MPDRVNGGVFNQQVITGSQRYFVIQGADFSGAFANGQPVAFSSAEIIFNMISVTSYINIMNPYSNGISFALEINRSNWDAGSLQTAIQALGTDVGVDHVDCSVCTVQEVPFDFQYLGSGGGSSAFIDLTDVTVPAVPHGYVLWNSTGTVLEYSPTIPFSSLSGVPSLVNKIIAGPNIVVSPASGTGTVTISASGAGSGMITVEDEGIPLGAADTLNFTGSGVSSSISGNTVTVNIPSPSAGYNVNYIPVPPGTNLLVNKRYYVTSTGTVFLPNFTGVTLGTSVAVTKATPNANSVLVVSVNGPSSISTDIGSTDTIEIDATVESLFIYDGTAWSLQIGSVQ